MARIYEDGDNDHQEFIQNLALFLTSFLSSHLQVVENGNRSLLLDAHLYLLKISEVEDREVFKVCLEYWLKLVNSLYHEAPVPSIMDSGNPYALLSKDAPLMLNGSGTSANNSSSRRSIYASLMSDLRLIMINNMVKPEEVIDNYYLENIH